MNNKEGAINIAEMFNKQDLDEIARNAWCGIKDPTKNVILPKKEEGLRFNEGKNRLDLVPPILVEEVGKILTFGASKYGEKNYLKGMPWSKCIASLKRHLTEFEKGIDEDNESHELHISHVIVNAMFLLEYYKHAPQFDDRPHGYLNKKKICVDLDDVCVAFSKGWCEKYELGIPEFWQFDRKMKDRFEEMRETGMLDEFYLNLKPLIDPSELNFEIDLYVTARPVSSQISEQWLHNNGFPSAPVITVGIGNSKLNVLKEHNIHTMIDDSFTNFIELNKGGINCLLYDSPANKRHFVGYKRIKDFRDFKERFL